MYRRYSSLHIKSYAHRHPQCNFLWDCFTGWGKKINLRWKEHDMNERKLCLKIPFIAIQRDFVQHLSATHSVMLELALLHQPTPFSPSPFPHVLDGANRGQICIGLASCFSATDGGCENQIWLSQPLQYYTNTIAPSVNHIWALWWVVTLLLSVFLHLPYLAIQRRCEHRI